MRPGNVLHLIKIFLLVALMKLHFQPPPCCVNICSLWYPRKPSNCVALAVFKPERQSTFSVGSVSLSRWVLIYSYSTHTLRWWRYQRGSKKQLPDSTNLLRMEIATERTSQKGLSSCAPGSCFTTPMGPHYPHANHIDGSSLPPWVNSCGSFCICLFVYLCLLWITFPNISNIRRFWAEEWPVGFLGSYHQDPLRLGLARWQA